MKRNGQARIARVVHAMQPNLIRDIGHLVGAVGVDRLDLQWTVGLLPVGATPGAVAGLVIVVGRRRGSAVDGLAELAGKDFHDAVGVGVVVNRGAFARVPHQ